MALGAAKTFVPGEILLAADLNTLNTNILNNALTLISPLLADLDANGFDLTGLDELAFTDSTANPTGTGRLRRNGLVLAWAVEDARTNTVARALILQATTTGVPAAGIGTGLLFRMESADEDPADAAEIQCVASDVTAGSEDTEFRVFTRTGGAAPTENVTFRGDGGIFFARADPATPAAGRLYRGNFVRAWGNVSITPTLNDSYNITSVADAGVGLVTITFATDFTNATYAAVGAISQGSAVVGFDNFAAGTVRATLSDNAAVLTDFSFTFMAIGDQ